MLGTLLLAAAALMPQDTTKTRISSDTTQVPADSSAVIDTTGWLFTDSVAVLDTSWTVTPGGSFISEIWDYLITGFGGPTPPIILPPPDTTLPPIDPTQPPAQPVVVQGPGCTDMADSVSYLCTVQFQPDVLVDSTYWGSATATTWFPGDSLQWAYVEFPCSVANGQMQSRSYRNDLRSDPMLRVSVSHTCASTPSPPVVTPPPGGGGYTRSWDFNDPNNLDLNKPLPTQKQEWSPDMGMNGTGAIVSNWWTNMPIRWQFLTVSEQPATKHYRVTAMVKITDTDGFPYTMEHEGSSIKLWRFCSNPVCGNPQRIGTLEYHKRQNPVSKFRDIWDHWNEGTLSSSVEWPGMPEDGLWHKWAIEWDYRVTNNLHMTFWLDDVQLRRHTWTEATIDISGPVTMSIFLDMYSCGPPGCQANINTGKFIVDDLFYEQLDSPVAGWDATWNFDDGSGVICGGLTSPCDWSQRTQCSFAQSDFPVGSQGCYRKHSFLPTGGVNGSGAIVSHWQTGMGIGFSPTQLTELPLSRHFMVNYQVKQTAPMMVGLNGEPQGSNRKLSRIVYYPLNQTGSAGSTIAGTILSGLSAGNALWTWEWWTASDPVSPQGLGLQWPTDSQWHEYQWELDVRDTTDLKFTFWLDGILKRTVHMDSRVGDLMAGQTHMVLSPFLEMYSCGGDTVNCKNGINTGDYIVDDFKYKNLE